MPDPRQVAVAHGRNEAARRGLFSFLRALDLHPIEWETAVATTRKGAAHNKEVLNRLFDMTQAVLVLFTADEEVILLPGLDRSDQLSAPRRQARANVFVEAGMAFVANPDRTIVLVLGPQETPSDLQGLNYVRFDSSPASRDKVRQRLSNAGCAVTAASDWLEAGEADLVAALTTPAPIVSFPHSVTGGEPSHIVRSEWLEQEVRFKNLGDHLSGIWMRQENPPHVIWNLTPMEGSSRDHLRAFLGEAKLARDLLVQTEFLVEPGPDPHDDWLNTVRALTNSETDFILQGSREGRKEEGRSIQYLERRSAQACVLLAGLARPTLS